MIANHPTEILDLQPLLEKLQYKGPDELRNQAEIDKAIMALARSGSDSAIPALIDYFNRTSLKPLQRRILQSIGGLYDALVLNFLIDASRHADSDLRELAVIKLVSWFPYDRVIEPLFDSLGKLARRGVWYEIVSTFAHCDNPQIVRRMRSFLTSDDPAYRCAAVVAMRLLNPPELASVMLVMLRNDADPDIRFRAAQALADARHPDIVDAFITALHDSEYAVRTAAYYGLIRQGDPRGIDPLKTRCEELSRGGKEGQHELTDCVGALSTLSGAEPIDFLLNILNEPEGYEPAQAVVIDRLAMLSQRPDHWAHIEPQVRAALPRLIDLFEQEKRSRLHFGIIQIFAALKAPETVEPLSNKLMANLSHKLTHYMIQTLGEIGDERAVPALIMALKQTDLDFTTIQALKRIGTPDALAAITSLPNT